MMRLHGSPLEPIGKDDHVIGRPSSSVELVEYGDYECPCCARAHHEMTEVLHRHGANVRYAFRHFPLTEIHPHALLAAQAAEAAAAQSRFWPMHSVLFENHEALASEDLLIYAEILGLDIRRFSRELRAETHLAAVRRDYLGGARSGVKTTPAFFVDGVRQERSWDARTLSAAIEKALANAARRTTP